MFYACIARHTLYLMCGVSTKRSCPKLECLWFHYLARMSWLALGKYQIDSVKLRSDIMDIVGHPRDLNNVFVAYAGRPMALSLCSSLIVTQSRWYRTLWYCEPIALAILQFRVSPDRLQTERRALRHYTLVIPPGAPGAIGYHNKVCHISLSP